MLVAEKNSEYSQAEALQIKVGQLMKDLEARKVYEMEQRHKKEKD